MYNTDPNGATNNSLVQLVAHQPSALTKLMASLGLITQLVNAFHQPVLLFQCPFIIVQLQIHCTYFMFKFIIIISPNIAFKHLVVISIPHKHNSCMAKRHKPFETIKILYKNMALFPSPQTNKGKVGILETR